MQTPTVTKKQLKNTLSGKKKKTEVIKNVLAKPYQNYWPLLSAEDNNQLKDTLDKFLPRIKPDKINVPYAKIKGIPKEERKKFRETLYEDIVLDKSHRQALIFGVNDVAQLIEKNEAGSVLIASDVQPRLLVQHIIDQSVLYGVPVLVVNDLRMVCKKKCGLGGAVVALKKAIKPHSELGLIQQTICNIYENYPVSENHINFHRRLEFSTTGSVSDTVKESACLISESDDDEILETKNYQLKRTGKKRAFIPEMSENVKVSAFINLDSGPLSFSPKKIQGSKRPYHPLTVKRLRGDKNRNKRKMKKVKTK